MGKLFRGTAMMNLKIERVSKTDLPFVMATENRRIRFSGRLVGQGAVSGSYR
jgi:hypothetical protein